MINTIEVKNTIDQTVSILWKMCNSFDYMLRAMDEANGLLKQDLWLGDTKDKCVLIHNLLEQYRDRINELVDQLKHETTVLRNNMRDFYSNSESIRMISSV